MLGTDLYTSVEVTTGKKHQGALWEWCFMSMTLCNCWKETGNVYVVIVTRPLLICRKISLDDIKNLKNTSHTKEWKGMAYDNIFSLPLSLAFSLHFQQVKKCDRLFTTQEFWFTELNLPNIMNIKLIGSLVLKYYHSKRLCKKMRLNPRWNYLKAHLTLSWIDLQYIL